MFALILISVTTFAQNRTAERIVRQQNSYYNYDAAIKRSQDGAIEALKLSIKQKKEENKLTPFQKQIARLRKKYEASSDN